MSQFFWPPGDSGITTNGPVRFLKDAVSTEVSLDTVAPANSTPLPVINLNPDGTEVGFATEAKQDTQITQLASLRAGKSIANAPYRNVYSSVNVTTGAYVTAIASLSNTCSEIEIFDSSGETLKLAIGAAASEVDQILIFPGGNGRIPLAIPAGTRISLRAVSANATVGEISINFYA
jgi:hypothetical protein